MKVAVGLSGGVDSSVAAALLKAEGHAVIGISMKIWDGIALPVKSYHACYGPDEIEDLEDARKVSQHLDIPFYVLDLSQEYKNTILHYFKTEYFAGRTPNPCIRCNQRIKFLSFLTKARNSGLDFDYFATGHYASVGYNEAKKRYLLKKASDTRKDQSYWLALLSQQQLSAVLFPLAAYTKREVRELAKEFSLPVYNKPDSQDFFSGDHNMLLDAPRNPGPILDHKGSNVGTHQGIWFYTIGQRKGLGISSDRALYVTAIDEKRNTITVGPVEELSNDALIATDFNGIAIDELRQAMKVKVKIRYAHKGAEGVITPIANNKILVQFQRAQQAITPGQVAVFYDEDSVVGGAIIERAGGV